jgi:3-methyladenine DNA glycosylase/8-oxoguanine DNA glycosylase
MQIFPYGQAEIDHLKRRDKKLGAAMDQLGMIERRVTPDLFAALLRSIVAQQISAKAVDTIWGRLREKVEVVTPQAIAGLDVADIQQCGMSMRKAGYIKAVAEAAARGETDLSRLPELADEEIITTLSSLPGVGVWTAEMLLIHSLCRPDVVSWGDLAIRRGMMTLYGLKTLTRIQFDRYRKRYSPYGSVASIYLWALSAR